MKITRHCGMAYSKAEKYWTKMVNLGINVLNKTEVCKFFLTI